MGTREDGQQAAGGSGQPADGSGPKPPAHRHADVFSSLSPMRVAGFAAERIWVLIIFYSIMFYTGSDDVDVVLQLLYMNLTLSMGVMAVAFLLASVVFHMLARVGFVPRRSRPLVWCAAVLMSAGAALLAASSLANTQGTVILVLSALLTGTGSAVLMLCYYGAFSAVGSRVACLEVALAVAAALVVSFFLVLLPPVVADVVIVAAPLASAAFLCRACAANEGGNGGADTQGTGDVKARFSTRTRALLGKALAGALLIGLVQGFYDAFFGNTEQAATLAYDATLFIVGFTVIVVLIVLACAAVHDMLFFIYKISMGLFALACVLSVFLGRDGLYAAAVFFAGYMCFTILLTCVCIEMSNNFGIGSSIVFGIAFAVLYAGELVGSNLNEVLASSEVTVMQCCLVAVCVLFCVVLFLFTETDLVAVGIGEVRRAPDAGRRDAGTPDADAPGGGAADAGEPGVGGDAAGTGVEAIAQAMARDYGLSAREAEVLPLLLAGRTISRIQDALFISAGTVSTHIRHIYHKTGVARKQELLDLGELYAQGKAPKQHGNGNADGSGDAGEDAGTADA